MDSKKILSISIKENLEVLSDPRVMANIMRAEKEYAQGQYISWEEMKKELHRVRRPALALADKGHKKYAAKRKKK